MHPIVKVTVDGKPVSEAFTSSLVSVTVVDKEGVSADTVTVELDDTAKVELPRRGAKIAVSMGFKDTGGKEVGVQSLGEFVVDEVEGKFLPYSLKITGKSADMRETLKEQKNRHWDKKKVKDIVEEVAKDHGLKAAVDSDVGGHEYEWLGQFDESDMNILERMALRHDALFTIKEGRVIFAKKGAGRSASGKAVGDFNITPEIVKVGSGTFSINDRGSFGKVVGYYQDKDKVERKEIEVENDVSESPAIYRLREHFASEEEAKKAAQSKSNQLSRGGITTSVQVIGNSSIRAGGKFTYSGIRPGIDGIPFIIETAEHSYKKSEGYWLKIDGKVEAGKGEKSAKKAKKTNGTTRASDAKDKAKATEAAASAAPPTAGGLQPVDVAPNDGFDTGVPG